MRIDDGHDQVLPKVLCTQPIVLDILPKANDALQYRAFWSLPQAHGGMNGGSLIDG